MAARLQSLDPDLAECGFFPAADHAGHRSDGDLHDLSCLLVSKLTRPFANPTPHGCEPFAEMTNCRCTGPSV